MSENEQAGEKTEQPTEKRLRDAREEGNVPQSRELGTAAVFGAAVVAMMLYAGTMANNAQAWMKQALSPEPGLRLHPQALFGHFGELCLQLLLAMWPLVLICLLACFLSPVVMGTLRWSNKSLVPKFSRLSPMAGMKRLYGPEAIAEFVKSLLRVAFVGTAAGLVVWHGVRGLRDLVHQPLEAAMVNGLGFTLKLLLATGGAMVLLAAIDAPYQRWNWMRKLKMTREELRREMKESEGSAVALKYDGGKMGAPTVVALGVDETALRIREVADGNRVPLVSAPPLARALYREGKLGKEIPVRLYSAVAQVLSYVYQLRAWRGGPMPAAPSIDVDEFGQGGRP
jgi:flagellar biosynthesis protein FlhB